MFDSTGLEIASTLVSTSVSTGFEKLFRSQLMQMRMDCCRHFSPHVWSCRCSPWSADAGRWRVMQAMRFAACWWHVWVYCCSRCLASHHWCGIGRRCRGRRTAACRMLLWAYSQSSLRLVCGTGRFLAQCSPACCFISFDAFVHEHVLLRTIVRGYYETTSVPHSAT